MAAATETLARVPLLAGLDRKSLASLAQAMQERTFDAGTQATVEGQVGLGFFIVLEGSATVTIDGRKVGTLGPDDWFGEMALLGAEGKRMATITADTDLRCVGMTAWQFRPFLAEHPDITWQVMETMARRIAIDSAPPA